MGLFTLILVLGAFVFLLGVGVTVALVFALALRRPGRPPYDPDNAPSPLQRAQSAAAVLTAAEWEEFRRWVNGRAALPPAQREGIR